MNKLIYSCFLMLAISTSLSGCMDDLNDRTTPTDQIVTEIFHDYGRQVPNLFEKLHVALKNEYWKVIKYDSENQIIGAYLGTDEVTFRIIGKGRIVHIIGKYNYRQRNVPCTFGICLSSVPPSNRAKKLWARGTAKRWQKKIALIK